MATRRLLLLIVLACAACSKEAPQAPAAPAAATTAAPATTPAPATTAAAAAPAPAPADRVFTAEELAQMVAPIALYPDPLLAQVLMAATYPGDVADAAAWSKANPKAAGDAAVRQVADQPWDPSVQALAAFPQALATLGQDPGWVQRLGDAFLAQPDDVMDAVQVLRHKAQDADNLATNEYQKISTQPAAPAAAGPAQAAPVDDSGAGAYSEPTLAATTDTIIIESADPQVVYVPSYNPTTAYGTWAYPSYPPPYYPPPSAYYPAGGALVRGLAWGTGVAIADSLWGGMDWNNNDVNINVNSYNSINTNRQISRTDNTWRHDSINRDGVPYRDQRSRDQYSNRLADSGSRDHLRGDDANRARQREQARQSMQGRGMEAPARTNREAQQRAERAQRDIAQRDAGQRDRAAAGGRDAQRDRAQAATADRQRQAQQRDRAQTQQRDRSQAQQRDRAQAQQRDRQASAQRQQAGQHRQQTQHRQQGANNNASRNQARQQAQRQQRPHNDAFNGARQPQQSRSQAQRGHASQGHSRQQQASRQQPSKQVNRQPHSGGGAQHAQRSGGARTGGGHRR